MDYSPDTLRTQAEPGMNLPFSLEAEQSVLGAILLEPSCLNVVMDLLPREEYFYAVNNQMIYGAMRDMFVLGQPVDFVTVLEKLKENREFDQDTGKVYLTQLAQLVPSIDNVEVYAQIVRDKYDMRSLMKAARSILDDASEGAEDPSLLLDAAEERIYRIRQGKSVQGLQRLGEVLLETFDRLDQLNSPDKERYQGLPTGIRELARHHHRPEPLGPDRAGGPARRGQDQPGAEHRPARGGDRGRKVAFSPWKWAGSSWPPACWPARPW